MVERAVRDADAGAVDVVEPVVGEELHGELLRGCEVRQVDGTALRRRQVCSEVMSFRK